MLTAEHTRHSSSTIGIVLALQLAKTIREKHMTLAINVDNQAAIKAFSSELRSPGQHLAREALRMANRLQKKKGKARNRIMIRWTAGHEGVEGNELADGEAKKAAEGKTSDKGTLPPYLRRGIPINPSAVKQHHNKQLKKQWRTQWHNSERGKKDRKMVLR
jgi:ribonuclease HI